MPKKLWRQQNRQEAARVIGALLDARTDNGWHDTFQNLLYFRALSSLASNPIPSGHVMKVLTAMKEAGEGSVEHFEKHSAALRGQYRKARRPWSLVAPFYAELDSRVTLPRSFTVMGTRYTLRKWGRTKDLLEKNDLPTHVRSWCPWPGDVYSELCLAFESEGVDCSDACYENQHSYDVLRGLIEFTLGSGKRVIGVVPMSKASVPHPPWVAAVHSDRPFDFVCFIVEKPMAMRKNFISKERFECLKADAHLFRDTPDEGSTLEVVADGLRLFAQAFDESHEHQRLLRWWQLAERLTLADDHRGKTELVARRLILFCCTWKQLDTPALARSLTAIMDMRNRIVHTGVHGSVTHEDCDFMQAVCATAIRWLCRHRKEAATQDVLERLYQLALMDDNARTAIRTALRLEFPT